MKIHPNTKADTDQGRLKLWEAATAVSLITALAVAGTAMFAVLTARCLVVDTIGCLRRKGKDIKP